MASIRKTKKDVDYLIGEVIGNCSSCLFFNAGKKSEDIINIIEDAVELRNSLIQRINNPIEKNNRKLVKRYYKALRMEMINKVDELFSKLSGTYKS